MKLDIIGDIHGCLDELLDLLDKLKYHQNNGIYSHPHGNKIVFIGDITDRGPDSIAVIRLVYQLVMEQKIAYYVPGNHCNKLYRFFLGNRVQEKHGLETTVAEWKSLNESQQMDIQEKFMTLYEKAPLYLHFEDMKLVVAHAGIKEHLIGQKDGHTKSFVLYGDVTGQTDHQGKPIRRDWAKHYRGEPWIVYGHTPVIEPRQINRTINIDTGCVFGNKLTAFQFPEQTIISVPSNQSFQPERFTDFPDNP
ncbi:bis(5'-nucleosyl)-tetraphosphatase PrpE [asymmetrical] [Oceanobacillus oncorhynchi subsp. incaldanensis]|uniref:Bis(5'-nucleosyl)-tetraphosphatase PrpE n=1 Tax=Oceanobacillus aidingensis TaxID=645964 RepID=A0ABV9JYV9_9BACI|nr:bis(5'-nucleosyl)-tetraphosphatase PrpE [Oceanobacillus oncorhynchi]MDM8102461.1 bis(5'-nucleosyl)-tetraphosphatase PrpE [Oceanobacillus oncorhynchi]GIO20815.1 bis(5'-nucleosyl)-tetraphosphatase PrpE [asymmetrical] [Oceanobacillus oncorhynchi subsp. incaldanensis]